MERILTTHVGSLVRPQEVRDFMAAVDRGEDVSSLQMQMTQAIKEVVRHQAEVGIDIVNDGEYSRASWSRYIRERVDGLEKRVWDGSNAELISPVLVNRDRLAFPQFYASGPYSHSDYYVCTGPIVYSHHGHEVLQQAITNLKAALAGVDVTDGFMTSVAPASAVPGRNDEFYASEEEYVYAFAEALREEYKAIVEAGLILQVDDAFLASQYDTMMAKGRSVEEYRSWAQLRLDALNYALRGLPEDRTRYHVCWGSWHGPHTGDVPLRDIVDLVLQVRCGGYLLEGANPRHEHEWRVWESVKLPEGRKLIPGVLAHTTNVVEHPELVAERLTRLARLVGPENVIGSTDCGFAQGAPTERVHPSIMWAKLHSLAEGAALATSELEPVSR
jgi:5-methyltetrahydropteroyltriglutamate--homocysteine methyltransferase